MLGGTDSCAVYRTLPLAAVLAAAVSHPRGNSLGALARVGTTLMTENDPDLRIGIAQQHVQQEGQTNELPAGRVTPSLGLYQATFPLSEADFMRLQKSSPAMSAVGGAVLAFGISYALPVVVRLLKLDSSQRDWSQDDLWIGGVIATVGLIFLAMGLLYSRDRNRLMKRIREHFAQNPGHHEVRGAGK